MPTLEQPLSNIIPDSLTSLELPGVLEEVSSHALSEPGREAVLAAVPLEDSASIADNLTLVGQIREVVGLDGTVGLADLIPMEGLLSRLDHPSTVYDAEEIIAVADLLSMTQRVHDRLAELPDRFALLRSKAEALTPRPLLRNRIAQCFDEHGMIRPTASARLMEIHGRIHGVRDRIRKRLEGIVRDRDLARIVQEDYITLRNDRYVILLRPEFKGLMDGIVHDHSRSGASVYVEPFEAVEFNNQIASLMDEERDEVLKIFAELTNEIRSERETVLENYRALVFLDAFQARALYAAATSSCAPELTDDGFSILGARHPLLLATGDVDVVPMDVIQAGSTLGTVISGANMGGKTVALKIAGLFPLMARCGLMLPAREGTRIQPFARIMANIGDDQDIRGRVSSFSGHMMRIKTILEEANRGDLVLLDELGSATDPDEGSALAMAIMDALMDRGVRVVVTTHLTHLKAYAMGRQNMKNVSVEFHPSTLQPTFRLVYDLPGESHAIQAAERLGLPPEVTRAARGYMDKASGGSSQLLESLRTKMAETEDLRQQLEENGRSLELELESLKAQREEIVEFYRREAREAIRVAERQIADLQQSLKAGTIKRGHRTREELARIKSELVRTLGTPLEKIDPSLGVGSRVKVTALGREGVVTAMLDKGRVEIAVGKMTVRSDAEDLVVLPRESKKNSPSKKERIGVHIPIASPKWEVNVIGMRVDEALPVVEKAIDEALMGGLATVNIIHGKGTGRLKKAIWEHLATHAFVRDFQPSDIHSGGEGVTVVNLESD